MLFRSDDIHRSWTSRTFSHPSNFDTLALDPSLREEIRADLLRFVGRKDHYMRVGRAWKRGYVIEILQIVVYQYSTFYLCHKNSELLFDQLIKCYLKKMFT